MSDAGPRPWTEGNYDLASHEVSHIVEGASRGVHGSPAFGLWGDSKWAEFYQYDLYVGLGMDAKARGRVLCQFLRRGNLVWLDEPHSRGSIGGDEESVQAHKDEGHKKVNRG